MIRRLVPILGYVIILGLVWLMSRDRRSIRYRPLAWAVGLQVGLATLMFLTPVGEPFFLAVNRAVVELLGFTTAGTTFLLGEFGQGEIAAPLHCFLFLVLPTIIFFSSLMAVLYHLRVMQTVVGGLAWVLRKTLGISAAEAMVAAANVFVGHTEAPLVVKPYIAGMTRSELMAVMISGFGTMAGGVILAYSGMLGPYVPDAAGHIVTASLLNAPASLLIAKMLLPETQTPETLKGAQMSSPANDRNVVGAAARGAAEGVTLFINVAAMLLAFIALVALTNAVLSGILSWVGVERYGPDGRADALQWTLGQTFSPLAWLCGVSWDSASFAGRLLAEKFVLNEFVAYTDLTDLLRSGTRMAHRDVVISIYALCGFANVSSIAIQIGGIGGMAPSQKGNLVKFGLVAMLGGFLASCLSACVAAVFMG